MSVSCASVAWFQSLALIGEQAIETEAITSGNRLPGRNPDDISILVLEIWEDWA